MNRNLGLENKQDTACFCIELKNEITMAILWDMMQIDMRDLLPLQICELT